MTPQNQSKKWIESRPSQSQSEAGGFFQKRECEGGCGVIGIASDIRIAGKHLLKPLEQMRNRGNGKGGGIAAVGLDPQEIGVDREILEKDYLLAIGYLDLNVKAQLEKDFIQTIFEIDCIKSVPSLGDYKKVAHLEIQPPDVMMYFVRVKPEVIHNFREKYNVSQASDEDVGAEIVYQNSFLLNQAFYNSSGSKSAFVLSHAKNLLVLKMVGYGDDVVKYYQLENFHAHVWIGHHRYPTKGRVWHPGGAHPFIGLNEALVHNGDFANYGSITEYLAQKNIFPHFLTDTEVGVLVFDYLVRTLKYPLEYVIECLAPTSERDFTLLNPEKQRIYHALQRTHIHCSPDGPWFFLIAQSLIDPKTTYRLIGITDTSMLRPQVFALQKGEVSLGFAASEKQAIDASLESLSLEDSRIWNRADLYWSARGGSHTDGGAFIFTVSPKDDGTAELVCSDKFGYPIVIPVKKTSEFQSSDSIEIQDGCSLDLPAISLFKWAKKQIEKWTYEDLQNFLEKLGATVVDDRTIQRSLDTLTLLIDQRYPATFMCRSKMLSLFDKSLSDLSDYIHKTPSSGYCVVTSEKEELSPQRPEQTLLIDAKYFSTEDRNSLALTIVKMIRNGFKKFLILNCRGHRFIGNGMGVNSVGVRIDVFGSSGDYLSSGIDGAEIYVHGSAQDQIGQIMKDGKLVIYGDVGQTFLYGAKGGKSFIMGNAAGRPLINAVGVPQVIINGTCLDYLAESFMAGNPLEKGGFVVLNAIAFDEQGNIIDIDNPYPGSNLFSLASGGAIYIRDPKKRVTEQQLNGGEIVELAQRDWNLLKPSLEENESLFQIPIARLLEHNGRSYSPFEIYRKIRPSPLRILEPEEAWVTKK